MTKIRHENGWALTVGTVGLVLGGGPVGAIVGGFLGHKLDNYVNDRQRDSENKHEYAMQLLKDGYTTDEIADKLSKWDSV